MTLTVLGTTTSVLLGDGENYWLRTKEEQRKREMFGDCKKESQRLRGESKDYWWILFEITFQFAC